MEEWLRIATNNAALIIDGMALLAVAVGTLEAFISALALVLRPSATGHKRRKIWLRYARWLVAGLTFQLAADIIETSIAPSWREVGQLGAIAVIRTFLNFFLERDVIEVSERDVKTQGAAERDTRSPASAPPLSGS